MLQQIKFLNRSHCTFWWSATATVGVPHAFKIHQYLECAKKVNLQRICFALCALLSELVKKSSLVAVQVGWVHSTSFEICTVHLTKCALLSSVKQYTASYAISNFNPIIQFGCIFQQIKYLNGYPVVLYGQYKGFHILLCYSFLDLTLD